MQPTSRGQSAGLSFSFGGCHSGCGAVQRHRPRASLCSFTTRSVDDARMEPVRWGLMSTAKINQAILNGASQTDRAVIVAVASRDRRRGEEYAREHNIARVHTGYESLLDDRDVEAVYISLPNSLHVEWSVRALQAGKHVLCEKPLGRHPEEVERAFDAADRAGRILTEAFMYRHHPQTHRLTELVDEGAIGE